MKSFLPIELAFFFTDVFKVINVPVQRRREENAQLAEHRLRASRISKSSPTCAGFLHVGLELDSKEPAEFLRSLFVDLHTGGNGNVPVGSGCGRGGTLALACARKFSLQSGA